MMITPNTLLVLLLSLPFLLVQTAGAGSGVRRNKRVLKGSPAATTRSANKHAVARRELGPNDDKFDKEVSSDSEDRRPTAPAAPPVANPETRVTPAPTFAPTTRIPRYSVTTEVADAFGNVVTQAECDKSNLYNDSNTKQVEQLVSYQYQLTTIVNANPVTAARSVESRLQSLLARRLLDCVYSDTAMQIRGILEYWSVSSQPIDQLDSSRTECDSTTTTTTTAAGTTVNCYIIQGGLTVNYFTLMGNGGGDEDGGKRQRRALLQEQITDVRVLDTLGPIMRDLFASGRLKDEYGEIVDTQWMGFTNVANSGEETGNSDTTDRGDISVPGATGTDTSLSSSDDRSLKVIPAVALSFTIVALLALIVLGWKRHRFQKDKALKASQLEANNTTSPSSTYDDASVPMQQSLHSGIHAPLKYPIGGTLKDVEVDVAAESSMMSEEMPPTRDYRMRETDTGTSCGMDMELLSAKTDKNDSSLWYPYEESREVSLTSGYSYNKGPAKVYVLEDCASFEESTINLGPNFATEYIADQEEDSFTRPTFVKSDFGLQQSSMKKSMEDLKPHEPLSMERNSRYYASEDTVVL